MHVHLTPFNIQITLWNTQSALWLSLATREDTGMFSGNSFIYEAGRKKLYLWWMAKQGIENT